MSIGRSAVVEWATPARFDGLTEQRVHFGAGDAREVVAAEWAAQARPRTLVIGSNSERVATLSASIEDAVRWSGARMHVPRDQAERVLQLAAEVRAELIVAIGGGSSVGFAKWIAVNRPVSTVVVPTTLAGSEATSIWSVTEDGHKRVHSDPDSLPSVVIYDSSVLTDMPVAQLQTSYSNALAHAVDSLWAPGTTAQLVAAALEAVRQLCAGLSGIVTRSPGDLSRLQRGCYGSAVVFSAAGSGLHHKICHVLGGTFGLPHAGTHAAVLPVVAMWSAAADPDRGAELASALGRSRIEDALAMLSDQSGPVSSLADLGLAEESIPEAATIVASSLPPGTARPLDRTDVEALIRAAWSGAATPAENEARQ